MVLKDVHLISNASHLSSCKSVFWVNPLKHLHSKLLNLPLNLLEFGQKERDESVAFFFFFLNVKPISVTAFVLLLPFVCIMHSYCHGEKPSHIPAVNVSLGI